MQQQERWGNAWEMTVYNSGVRVQCLSRPKCLSAVTGSVYRRKTRHWTLKSPAASACRRLYVARAVSTLHQIVPPTLPSPASFARLSFRCVYMYILTLGVYIWRTFLYKFSHPLRAGVFRSGSGPGRKGLSGKGRQASKHTRRAAQL